MEHQGVIRQGDVYLFPVDEIPAGTKNVQRENGRVVLAHGEVTGHAHAFTESSVALLEKETDRYLEVTKEAVLKHEEHNHVEVPVGTYKVVRQREYSPEKIQYVRD